MRLTKLTIAGVLAATCVLAACSGEKPAEAPAETKPAEAPATPPPAASAPTAATGADIKPEEADTVAANLEKEIDGELAAEDAAK